MFNKIEILKAKEKWLESGFIGGAIACDFFLMKEMGMDIVYDSHNDLVEEYSDLLKRRIETDCSSLILMANAEIEKCIINKEEEINAYLCDEIYEHFKNSGKEYPLQIVGLHIDIITTLIQLNEKEKVYNYLHTIKETYQNNFGEKSYLFCRNWCYILNEIMLEILPQVAMEEFEENIDLFSVILKEDGILYTLCINIAIKRTNQEQKVIYIKEAIDLCEIWCKNISTERQKEIQRLIHGISAMYYRNIGEYHIAIKTFYETIEFVDDIHYKLFLLAQIATILYVQHEWKELENFFDNYKSFIVTLREPDENVAELYNIYGAYYMQIGNYHEAKRQIEKAISISENILGEEADTTIKFKCNRILVKYSTGEFNECNVQIEELLNVVSNNLEQYPESLPLVLNSLVAMSFKEKIDRNTVLKMKAILDGKRIKYDIASSIIFKSNLYCVMMASGDDYDEEMIIELRQELKDYFLRYPYSEGFLEYLKGEFCRLYQKRSFSSAYKILDEIETYLDKKGLNIVSREYLCFFIVRLKKMLYQKDYIMAEKWLMSMWKSVLLPLFGVLANESEDNAEYIFLLLYAYISLFISSAKQYPLLKITDNVLYEYILNFKYLEDLFYCNKHEMSLVLEKERWLSLKSVKVSKEKLIIECFVYIKFDMEDIQVLFANTNRDMASSAFLICFCLQPVSGIFAKYSAELVSNIAFIELIQKIGNIFDEEQTSQIEKMTWDKLRKYVNGKEKIYICGDISAVRIPLASMRIGEKHYWGELYQIVYCNSVIDVKDDLEILDISNSMFLGMSFFDDDKKNERNRIGKWLVDLPYVGLELEKLGSLTGGEVYLDTKVINSKFDAQQMEIMHFATHTIENKNDGTKALVVGKQKGGQYILLKSTDISRLDWTNIKLVIFSACETDEETWKIFGRHSLSFAAKKAGALFSISTMIEVCDGANCFFMVCLYKNFLRYRKIIRAFFETQKIMRTITKKEILADSDYLDIGMDYYLEDYEEESIPFGQIDDWAVYILQMN